MSSKLINRSSISEKGKFSYKSNVYDHQPEEEKRNYENKFVKVINNTLDESASAFTRKTKNPGVVRSAYHSVISFSNKLDDHESQDNTLNIIAFEKQIRAAEKVRTAKNTPNKK